MPLSAVEWTKYTVLCNLDICKINHKMNITQRYCWKTPTKYKIHFCDSLYKYEIYQQGNHTNLISLFYVDSIRGIEKFYRNHLIQFIKKGITAPKLIHKDPTGEFG